MGVGYSNPFPDGNTTLYAKTTHDRHSGVLPPLIPSVASSPFQPTGQDTLHTLRSKGLDQSSSMEPG